MKGRLKKILLIIVLLVNIGLQTVSAQQETLPLAGPQKPVMYSVFWNTLWGSDCALPICFSYHLASGIQLRESLITATTIGGVLGYGLGIYLVVSGLSFDKTYLLELPAPKFQAQQLNSTPFQTEMLPLVAQSAKYDHTKWELPIYTFRF
ncbi:MAG: hypothetical protein MAG581_01117 [Deltaproteobacteria bacterium]|nr:hypothetical protein [Deltaproteobacteria bacterium]